jgi:hypothetical protein
MKIHPQLFMNEKKKKKKKKCKVANGNLIFLTDISQFFWAISVKYGQQPTIT